MLKTPQEVFWRRLEELGAYISETNVDAQLADVSAALTVALHHQQVQLMRRTRHALHDYKTTGSSGALYNVMQFAASFGRWEAAQSIKRLRKELREARAALDRQG